MYLLLFTRIDKVAMHLGHSLWLCLDAAPDSSQHGSLGNHYISGGVGKWGAAYMPSWMSDVNVLELTFFFFPNINNNKELPTWLQELGNCYFIIKKKRTTSLWQCAPVPCCTNTQMQWKRNKEFFLYFKKLIN